MAEKEKKRYDVWTLHFGKWAQWGSGVTDIQNRSELVEHIQEVTNKANGCVRVRRKS